MNKKFWIISIFWGSCWGFAEATLGYLLHIVPAVSASIMFPIGVFCMSRAVTKSGSTASLWVVSLIAAAIKLFDILLPYHHISSIINPAICILMEAGAAFILFKLMDKQKNLTLTIMASSILWRALFLGWQQISPFAESLGKQIPQSELLFRLSIGVILNTIILSLFFKLEKSTTFQKRIESLTIGKATAMTTCALALGAEILIRSL